MKKIINGRRYDTEAAQELARDSASGMGPRDFHWWEERLFVKKTGEYFLYGQGGPMSRYAEAYGQNGWSGGERIMPMSLEEAQAWAEEHVSGDEYEEIFGQVEETDERRTVTYSLPLGTIEAIKRRALDKGVTMSDYIAGLVAGDGVKKAEKRTKYALLNMSMKQLDEELAAVEKRGAAYLPDPYLVSGDVNDFKAFLKNLAHPENFIIEVYTVDEDGEFLDGSDYDTVANFLKRS